MNDATPPPDPTGAAGPEPRPSGGPEHVVSNGTDPRPSPYEALRPTGRGPEAVVERAPAQGLGARLVADAPLKLLAVLVAVLLWNAVRDRILVEEPASVAVRLVPPDASVRVERGNDRGRVTLTLKGTRAEVERIRGELSSTSEPARYVFSVPAGVNSGRVGPLNRGDQLQFPVEGAASLVKSFTPELEATWHRIVAVKLKLGAPSVQKSAKYANVEYEPPQFTDTEVTVTGPAALFASGLPLEITPDPVDLSAWLDTDPDLYTPFPFESGFDEWRRSGPLRGTDLVEIRPERVRGTVMLRPRKSERVANRVRELWDSAELAREWELTIRASTTYDPATRLLTGELRGDPRALEALKKTPGEWSYAIAVPAPKPGEPPGENEQAEVFLWFRTQPTQAVRLASKMTVYYTLKKRGD